MGPSAQAERLNLKQEEAPPYPLSLKESLSVNIAHFKGVEIGN